MQPQINAIKQLLETNNTIASQLEEILIKALGQQAAWENCSTMSELTELEERFDDQEEIPNEFRWIWQLLWRSRVDLNDARINAQEVDLEEFLAKYDGATQVAEARLKTALYTERRLEERDRAITRMETEIDSLRMDVKERDQRVSSLKSQVADLETALELANRKAIAPNLDAFQEAVDKAVNPVLLEKIAERDRDIEILKGDVKDLCERLRGSANQISERDRQIQELEITVKNHREQFEDLKSHFQVTLKAINMTLNGLKGARKPDHVEEVDGVNIVYRRYDDNLSHAGKTMIIENQQRAIAEEARKLKDLKLKDFSFDDIPY